MKTRQQLQQSDTDCVRITTIGRKDVSPSPDYLSDEFRVPGEASDQVPDVTFPRARGCILCK